MADKIKVTLLKSSIGNRKNQKERRQLCFGKVKSELRKERPHN